ncbi:MAG: hypothetical protein AABX07_05470 [Nanoarchaeota archaeon]
MGKKGDSCWKILFLIAAIYDFVLGIAFFFLYEPIFSYFNIPLPDYSMYLQMAAAFVIAMGVGYYFIFLNLYRNVDLVKLGIVYKIAYAGLTFYWYFTDLANAVFMWFAVIDVIFIVTFISFLRYAKKDERYARWK